MASSQCLFFIIRSFLNPLSLLLYSFILVSYEVSVPFPASGRLPVH